MTITIGVRGAGLLHYMVLPVLRAASNVGLITDDTAERWAINAAKWAVWIKMPGRRWKPLART